jgi:hypothetical protein
MATNETSPAPQTPSTCSRCGTRPCKLDPWGTFGERCDDCERKRIDEVLRISAHYEQHPDECCCQTYLGRECCRSPVHGDWWRVNAISDGERFCYVIRARDRKEALQVGREMCMDNGEECVSVARARDASG